MFSDRNVNIPGNDLNPRTGRELSQRYVFKYTLGQKVSCCIAGCTVQQLTFLAHSVCQQKSDSPKLLGSVSVLQ